MKIREALKQERLAQHKTQSEWIKKIDMSVSHYSEIESGYSHNGKKSDIDSEDLLVLLESNKVDVLDFFNKVKNEYAVNSEVFQYQKLSQELTDAFNEADEQKAENIKNRIINKPNIDKALYYNAILVTADLKDHMASLSQETIKRIDQYIYRSDEWLDDRKALIIFGNSMPILKKEVLISRMGKILRKYAEIEQYPEIIQRRISTICINYLYNAIFLKSTDKYLTETFKLIQKLPSDDAFGMKKITAKYFEDVLNGDITHIHELKEILSRSGLQEITNRLPI